MTVRLLTTEGVAERFRTSPSTVRYWRHIGVGPNGIRVGRRVLYDEAECERWWQTRLPPRRTSAPDRTIAPGPATPRLNFVTMTRDAEEPADTLS